MECHHVHPEHHDDAVVSTTPDACEAYAGMSSSGFEFMTHGGAGGTNVRGQPVDGAPVATAEPAPRPLTAQKRPPSPSHPGSIESPKSSASGDDMNPDKKIKSSH